MENGDMKKIGTICDGKITVYYLHGFDQPKNFLYTCTNCGMEQSENWDFCPYCGSKTDFCKDKSAFDHEWDDALNDTETDDLNID